MRSGDEKCNLYMYYSVRGCLDLKFLEFAKHGKDWVQMGKMFVVQVNQMKIT